MLGIVKAVKEVQQTKIDWYAAIELGKDLCFYSNFRRKSIIFFNLVKPLIHV